MKKILFVIFGMLFGSSYAGTKGFDVLILNIGDQSFFNQRIYESYSYRWSKRNQDECWESMGLGDGSSGIKGITKKKLPNGINSDLAKRIWEGNSNAIKTARKIMHMDDGLTNSGEGYHGMYIINPKGDKLTIMGMGVNDDLKHGLNGISSKLTITLDQGQPDQGAKVFEQSLCKVSKPFNIGFHV